jgi:hypothetical protein
MSSPNQLQDERRGSDRCCMYGSQQAAELVVDKRRIAVRVLNQSSGGLAAVADSDPGLRVDDVAALITTTGQFMVRVARVGPVDDDQGADGAVYLGLQRIEQMPSTSPGVSNADDCRTIGPTDASPATGKWQRIRGVLLAVGIALALLAALAALIRSNNPLVRRFLAQQTPLSQAVSFHSAASDI